jgi:hypothetical protein
MLSRCANPACSNTLRYLHEGKLYLMESKWGPAKTKAEAELPDTGKFRAIEYAWLCSSCCRDMTVHIDHEGKIRIVRKPDSEWIRVGNF